MPLTPFEKIFSEMFGLVGTVIDVFLGCPRPEPGPEILEERILGGIFPDQVDFTLLGPIASKSFRIRATDEPLDDEPAKRIPDIALRFLHIDGFDGANFLLPTGKYRPEHTLQIWKGTMFDWEDIPPTVRRIITHPEETIPESFSATGRCFGRLLERLLTIWFDREGVSVRFDYWPRNYFADDEGDRVYAYVSKRLTQRGQESFPTDVKPGLWNPLIRRLRGVDGIGDILVHPYVLVLYVSDRKTWEASNHEVERIIRTFS